MKLVWVAAPIVAIALWVALRALRGRPLPRATVSTLVALLLLGYLVATSALGIFWMSQLNLPPLDWHYLLGYALLLLTVAHVALQLPVLTRLARRHAPAWLVNEERTRFRPGARSVGSVVTLALVSVVLVWVTRPAGPAAPGRVVYTAPADQSSSDAEGVRVWIQRGSKRQSALDYLHEQSSHARARPLPAPQLAVGVAPPVYQALPGARRVALPEPRDHSGVSVHEAFERVTRGAALSAQIEPGLSREALGELLHYAAGVTSHQAAAMGVLLRAAPSAGALYPIDLYVAVRRVADVEAGIYYYHPRDHDLVAVGEGGDADSIARHVSRPDLVTRAPVTLVLGATFDRTVAKYRERAYRYVALDAGHLAANLMLTGAALGQRCALEPLFDDAGVSRAVGAAGEGEGALLVVPCGLPAADAAGAVPFGWLIPPHALPEVPADLDALELARLSHRMTSWRLVGGKPRQAPADSRAASASTGLLPLSAPAPATGDLYPVIARRRSSRDHADRPVDADTFAGVLRDVAALAPTVRPGRLVELYVMVRAVAGVEPGVYRYVRDVAALELVRGGDPAAEARRAGYRQEVLGRAAFVLAWAMRTGRVTETDGARGYRHAHFDAGLAGGHAYVSAVARDLGVCGVGAFYDDAMNALIDGERRGERILYLAAIGPRN